MALRDKVSRNLVAEQAAWWHVTLGGDEVDCGRKQEFVRWLRASPIHVEEYLRITGVADGLAEVARTDASPLLDSLSNETEVIVPLRREVFDGTVQRVSGSRLQDTGAVSGKAPRLRRLAYGAVAAVFVAALLISAWHWNNARSSIETFVATAEQGRSVWLPDHTRVQIGANASITAIFSARERKVLLNRGRAYFDVAKDSARPFSVRAGPTTIRDIGTAFAVDEEGPGTTITVAEGRVKLWDSRMPRSRSIRGSDIRTGEEGAGVTPLADLVAGEQAHIDGSGQLASLERVNVQEALAWTLERISFDNQTIADVASQLNRYNHVEIIVMDPEIGDRRITGVLESQDVSAFIAFVRHLPGVAVEKRGTRVIVYAK